MKNVAPDVSYPVVDRLAFVLPCAISPLVNQKKFITRIRQKLEKEIEEGNCKRAYSQGSRYREKFHIRFPSGAPAYVQIGALQPEKQKGGVHVTLNPARLQPGDVDHFHDVMGRIVGIRYRDLMSRPLINQIDFAIDVKHANLSRMLVTYNNAQRCTVFGKRMDTKGHIETYNFGSVDSDYMTTAYDKRQERVNAVILKIARHGLASEGLKSNFVKQLERTIAGPNVMRVEVRGKKMRGLDLWNLEKLPNRFARFSFLDLDATGAELPAWLEAAFVSLCRDVGVKAALATFKNTEHARQINAYWRSRRAAWWKPEAFWQEACHAVRGIGLFPADAFDPLE